MRTGGTTAIVQLEKALNCLTNRLNVRRDSKTLLDNADLEAMTRVWLRFGVLARQDEAARAALAPYLDHLALEREGR